jgi:hypothetical protein
MRERRVEYVGLLREDPGNEPAADSGIAGISMLLLDPCCVA